MYHLTGKRKGIRDTAVREFAKAHPDQTQKQIGLAFGISQGTVSKVITQPKKLDKPTSEV